MIEGGDPYSAETPRPGATTPSNIVIDAEGKGGLSDALIMNTCDGTVAEIQRQDVANFLILEESMRQERIEVSELCNPGKYCSTCYTNYWGF